MKKGLEKRSSVTNIDYINFLKGNYKNLKLGNIDREKESKNIYRNDSDFYEFHHINEIPFDDKGNFKDTEEVLKLKAINAKHHI